MANIKQISITLATADPDGVSTSQSPGAAGNLTITGALASGGVATFDVARRVCIVSAGNDSAKTFTIYGTDRNGYTQSEAIAGGNVATVYTLKDFKTVTRVAISAASAGAVTVGTNGVASTAWYVGDYRTGKTPIITCKLSTGAVMTYTIESTPTNLNDMSLSGIDAQIAQAQSAVVFPSTDTSVVTASTDQQTNFINGMPGMRATINTFTSGTLTITFVTASNAVA